LAAKVPARSSALAETFTLAALINNITMIYSNSAPSVCLSVRLSVCLSVRLSVSLPVCLSVWHDGKRTLDLSERHSRRRAGRLVA